MRRTLRTVTTIAAAAALTVASAAAASAEKPGWAGPPSKATIVETAVTLSDFDVTDPLGNFDDNPNDFDILVAAVILTGTTDLLDGSDDYTVFAPTDQAFIDVANAVTGGDLSEGAAALALVGYLGDDLDDVLAYHVTEDWRPSPSVVNAKKITMLDGNTISYDADSEMLVANSSEAMILMPDVRTADGGIHVIDSVLLP